ncbi:nuclear import protein MOG1, putative [Babesia microti strain RI]|uniref:Nuclear import protein MOG1, putative n=1 Tax=Babesia microti (strain RI) TaxID=1133968 RepID=A0A1N6LWM2_BABMR|nr:nuclear import protein MOG1, putative [Babesia microti strain RI]SIO73269.1 nuclear import protein MOG1, putative [Babesia microti strain RI]|eukprot:XP_021337374.1 nuclear import protein MOG1, putative [Babesia microti strain RI]
MTTRSFWEGAIEVTLPQNYLDLSESYLVPDNQTVYSNDKGSCFILEFVQPQPLPNEKSAQFYYNDIAQCNEGVADEAMAQEISSPIGSDVKYCAVIRGKQTSKKPGSNEEIPIYVSLALYRFITVDMLMSLTSEIEQEQEIWDGILQSLKLIDIHRLFPHN